MTPKKAAGTADLSLVVCTYGRTKQLYELINSIKDQSILPKEIIIIDQNPPRFLDTLIKDCAGNLNIIHKNVRFTGASKARNYGAGIATGKIIAFPDDDCIYRENTIKSVMRRFEQKDELGVLIAGKDETLQTIRKDKNLRQNAVTEIHTILGLFQAKAETSNIFARRKRLKQIRLYF